jgi:hypothetical protein
MKHLIVIAVLLAGFVWFAAGRIPSGPYSYDEADYMFAASRGLWANWTDTSTQTLPQFIRVGLGRGLDPAQRAALSDAVRNSGDVLFYRHWHGPLFYYGLILLSPLKNDERSMRAAMLVFPALTGLLIYFGLLWVLPGAWLRTSVAVLACVLFLWSYAAILTTELAPHQMFALWAVAALILIAKVRESGERKWWFMAVIATALAFATLEVAFILTFVLVAYAWLERERLRADWPFAAKSLLVFVTTILIVWPAALFKLSFIKAYAFMAYLALFRKAPWGNVTFTGTWAHRFQHAPVEWLLLIVAFVLWWIYRGRSERTIATVFLMYGLLMLAFLLRVNSDTPRYILPFLPAFHVFTGIMLAAALTHRPAATRISLLALLCLLRFADTARYLHSRQSSPDPRPAAALATIRQLHLEDKRLLVPHDELPMLHYYFPHANLRSYEETPKTVPSGFDAVLQPDYRVTVNVRAN